MAAADTVSLHDTVTNRIIRELEAGHIPWVQPWASSGTTPLGLPLNAATGRAYSGVNILLLWAAALEQARPSQRWLTFKQALAQGGAVRKGEKVTVEGNTLRPGHPQPAPAQTYPANQPRPVYTGT